MDNKYFHSVILQEDRCIGCTSCLKVCPTEAIRLRDGKARIIGEKCIDCGECIRICPNHAKSAIADNYLDIIKKFKYTIAIPSLVLYGQFPSKTSIAQMLSAVKNLGFDEVYEATTGSEAITTVIANHILNKKHEKPLINSSCPAILRLIQIRFPDLLPNIIDIETPIEVTARIAKHEVSKRLGLDIKDIGVIFISPCTARVTSIRNPIGIERSYVDGVVSMKAVFGEILRNLGGSCKEQLVRSNSSSILWPIIGGQSRALGIENYLAVDGISEVIKVLEEIEMDKLDGLEFFEGVACLGGCVGGPLTIENSFISRNRIRTLAKSLPPAEYSKEYIDNSIKMYEDGLIRLTCEIEPRSIMRLDNDITKSIKKMEMIKEILKYLPGLDCGVCGAPTCKAFAEDIVRGENPRSVCLVKTMENFRNKKRN